MLTKTFTASCTGDNAATCGTKWYTGGYDGITGVGQDMSALETIQGLLLLDSPIVPKTQPNVTIQTVPVTSTYPLDPPTATAVPGSDASPSSAGRITNIGGRATSTYSENLGMIKSWAVIATPVVIAVAFGGWGVLA